jgi:Nif-specific regulatory protein
MREKMDVVKQIAATTSSVLLVGEAGVGKELVAQQMHLSSPFANGPFEKINCACDTAGINFKEGGTLFLDEVSLLSPVAQERLLEILVNGEGCGGGSTPRIIASTRFNLESRAGEGAFLRDLYYRLNVLPVYIPPLRERHEDIVPLAAFFLDFFMLETKKYFYGFTDYARETLENRWWHGNVRELKNCIERACIVTLDGGTIGEEVLSIQSDFRYTELNRDNMWDMKIAVDAFKALHIERALEANGFNQTKTAVALGVQRTYLSKLMRDLNISKDME